MEEQTNKPRNGLKSALITIASVGGIVAAYVLAQKTSKTYFDATKKADEMGLVLSILKRDNREVFDTTLATAEQELRDYVTSGAH